jgi:glycerophosphoryl diester phosphodiesterase
MSAAAQPSPAEIRSVVAGRPVAHRGLHDVAAGRIENTLSAVAAAIEKNFAIEVDIQLTRDGEAVVHHDEVLGRVTEGSGALLDMSVAELKAVPFKATDDRIPTLTELFALVAGRVPLIVEIKTQPGKPDVDARLTARFISEARRYAGPLAAMSFSPEIVAQLRREAPELIRGIVADDTRSDKHYGHLSAWQRFQRRTLLHGLWTQPHFASYCVDHLPAVGPWVLKNVFSRPLITWTVRRPDQVAATQRYADQMTFEGFVP